MIVSSSLKINRDLFSLKAVIKCQRMQPLDFTNFIQCLCNAVVLHGVQGPCQSPTMQVFVQTQNWSLS